MLYLRPHGWLYLLSVVVFAQAYLVDDTNSTLQYSGSGLGWAHYVNTSIPGFDNTKLFNATCSGNACYTTEDCHVQIPFTGSGITIYNMVHYPVNASLALDGGPSTQSYMHDNSCFDNPCYNITVFDVQSLKNDNHMLIITLLSYNGSRSGFRFDYAVVNETTSASIITSPSATTSSFVATKSFSTTTSSATPSLAQSNTGDKSSRSTPLAAAVGGTLAGLAVLAAIVFTFFYFRRRRITDPYYHRKYIAHPLPLPSASLEGTPRTRLLPLSTDTLKRSTSIPLMPIYSTNTDQLTSVDKPTTISTSSADLDCGKGEALTSVLEAGDTVPPSSAGQTTTGATRWITEPSRDLTEQQIGSIVQHLIQQNVPIPVVATVMEGILGRTGRSSAGSGDSLWERVVERLAPPSYDFQPDE